MIYIRFYFNTKCPIFRFVAFVATALETMMKPHKPSKSTKTGKNPKNPAADTKTAGPAAGTTKK